MANISEDANFGDNEVLAKQMLFSGGKFADK